MKTFKIIASYLDNGTKCEADNFYAFGTDNPVFDNLDQAQERLHDLVGEWEDEHGTCPIYEIENVEVSGFKFYRMDEDIEGYSYSDYFVDGEYQGPDQFGIGLEFAA